VLQYAAVNSRFFSSALLLLALAVLIYLIRQDVWGYFRWLLNVVRGNVG
jgi:hypothetical protein